MRDFLHRFYPYQALRLMMQRLRLVETRSTIRSRSDPSSTSLTPSVPVPSQDTQEPFDPVKARSQLVKLFRALKQAAPTLEPTNLVSLALSQNIPNAGLGVFLRGSRIAQPGAIVAMYPGTLYRPGEAIFFNSIHNRYILKCNDGVYVDGKAKGLSGSIFRSANGRDNYPGITPTANTTWMKDWNNIRSENSGAVESCLRISTGIIKNPLAVGQIVNNSTRSFPSNVRYQELDIRARDCPLELQEFLPNIWYAGDWHAHDQDHHNEGEEAAGLENWSMHSQSDLDHLRTVVLVTTRPVEEDEELYSTYIEQSTE
ncbi:SET domain-containing protein 9 [Gamsiella multidivaricata]|nr:SET domain-containing protein 9 [Gamsiella multidivaricata]